MGIPYLTRHLVPFSESVLLADKRYSPGDGTLHVQSLVVDGPSLVYHVYFRLLSSTDQSVGLFDAQPTCHEVSVGVMMYLLQLTNLGIKINKIIFDGALPDLKRKTRLSRLEKSRLKHEIFCIRNRNGLRASKIQTDRPVIDPERVLRARNLPIKYKSLPENPFMVSTVFEDLRYRWNKENIAKEANAMLCLPLVSLQEFPWANVTVMVPREADADCACVSRITGSAVLTNDSDLLLHDLGLHGSVLLLDSVEMSRWNPHKPTEAEIRALRLCPAVIARRLQIVDIRRLAFELRHNPQAGLAELIRRSKDSLAASKAAPGYLLFMGEYQPVERPHVEGDLTGQVPQCLDVRVSEIFWQYTHDANLSGGVLHMYLAILNDDHARRCAWEAGRSYRSLGYSVFNTSHPVSERFSLVHEYVRRGQRIAVDRVTLDNEQQVTIGMRALLERLTLTQSTVGDYTSPGYWRIFALSEIYCGETPKANLPNPGQLGRFLTLGYMGEKLHWADIHLLAQTQAVLYSLRILKQLLSVTMQINHCTSKVKAILAGLPPLHILMRSRHEVTQEFLADKSTNHFVDAFFQLCEQRSQAGVTRNRDPAEQCCSSLSHVGTSPDITSQGQGEDCPYIAKGVNFNMYELLALQ